MMSPKPRMMAWSRCSLSLLFLSSLLLAATSVLCTTQPMTVFSMPKYPTTMKKTNKTNSQGSALRSGWTSENDQSSLVTIWNNENMELSTEPQYRSLPPAAMLKSKAPGPNWPTRSVTMTATIHMSTMRRQATPATERRTLPKPEMMTTSSRNEENCLTLLAKLPRWPTRNMAKRRKPVSKPSPARRMKTSKARITTNARSSTRLHWRRLSVLGSPWKYRRTPWPKTIATISTRDHPVMMLSSMSQIALSEGLQLCRQAPSTSSPKMTMLAKTSTATMLQNQSCSTKWGFSCAMPSTRAKLSRTDMRLAELFICIPWLSTLSMGSCSSRASVLAASSPA
mmetsp:Transcript_2853/g.8201  ORF Transcript_2853/g.8201 Transcript_2853/m.8201 type:complete len:339 (+) Transcript_2853:450-1466(+)